MQDACYDYKYDKAQVPNSRVMFITQDCTRIIGTSLICRFWDTNWGKQRLVIKHNHEIIRISSFRKASIDKSHVNSKSLQHTYQDAKIEANSIISLGDKKNEFHKMSIIPNTYLDISRYAK